MEELRFADDVGRTPLQRGAVRPITAKMLAVARKPSHAWLARHELWLAARVDERRAEKREAAKLRKQKAA